MIKSEKKDWFRNICFRNGLMPTEDQIEQLTFYVALLLEWNKKINIISRKDEENVWTYHILHSVAPLFRIDIKQNSAIVDIGTGGGLPGVPLKILRPDLSLLCLDSTGKKINAVSQIVNDLKIANVSTAWGRAEDLGLKPDYAGKFDIALARAVAPLKDLVCWAKPFLKNRESKNSNLMMNENERTNLELPVLLAFKGGDLVREIELAKRKYIDLDIKTINLIFNGSEQLNTSDKKILAVHFKVPLGNNEKD